MPKILRHAKNYTSMKDILSRQNSAAVFFAVSSPSLLDVSAGNFQRASVDESGVIRAQMGSHSRPEMLTWCAHPVTVTVTRTFEVYSSKAVVQAGCSGGGACERVAVVGRWRWVSEKKLEW
jgi:hypothetical protein